MVLMATWCASAATAVAPPPSPGTRSGSCSRFPRCRGKCQGLIGKPTGLLQVDDGSNMYRYVTCSNYPSKNGFVNDFAGEYRRYLDLSGDFATEIRAGDLPFWFLDRNEHRFFDFDSFRIPQKFFIWMILNCFSPTRKLCCSANTLRIWYSMVLLAEVVEGFSGEGIMDMNDPNRNLTASSVSVAQ